MSSRAILSRSALGSLLCTRSDAMAITTVAQELHAHGHRAAATQLLAGCFVRLKRNSVYTLGRVTALRFPAAGGVVQMELEDEPQPILASHISNANPLADDAAYEAVGRQEMDRLAAARAAAGRPPGVKLKSAAAASWRKKVALAWAPQLQELLATQGMGKLLSDLLDARMITACAACLEPLALQQPVAAATAPSAGVHRQPDPSCSHRQQQKQQQSSEQKQQQPSAQQQQRKQHCAQQEQGQQQQRQPLAVLSALLETTPPQKPASSLPLTGVTPSLSEQQQQQKRVPGPQLAEQQQQQQQPALLPVTQQPPAAAVPLEGGQQLQQHERKQDEQQMGKQPQQPPEVSIPAAEQQPQQPPLPPLQQAAVSTPVAEEQPQTHQQQQPVERNPSGSTAKEQQRPSERSPSVSAAEERPWPAPGGGTAQRATAAAGDRMRRWHSIEWEPQEAQPGDKPLQPSPPSLPQPPPLQPAETAAAPPPLEGDALPSGGSSADRLRPAASVHSDMPAAASESARRVRARSSSRGRRKRSRHHHSPKPEDRSSSRGRRKRSHRRRSDSRQGRSTSHRDRVRSRRRSRSVSSCSRSRSLICDKSNISRLYRGSPARSGHYYGRPGTSQQAHAASQHAGSTAIQPPSHNSSISRSREQPPLPPAPRPPEERPLSLPPGIYGRPPVPPDEPPPPLPHERGPPGWAGNGGSPHTMPPPGRPMPLPGRCGPPPAMPAWLPPLLRAACKMAAFDNGVPFPAAWLLPRLDDLCGQPDCLWGARLGLLDICDWLEWQWWAVVDFRPPDGPWVLHLDI